MFQPRREDGPGEKLPAGGCQTQDLCQRSPLQPGMGSPPWRGEVRATSGGGPFGQTVLTLSLEDSWLSDLTCFSFCTVQAGPSLLTAVSCHRGPSRRWPPAVIVGPAEECASPCEIRGDDGPGSCQGTGSLDKHLYFTVTRAEPGALSQLLQLPWPPCDPAHLVSIHPTLPSQLRFSYFLVRASELSLGHPVSPRTEGQRTKKPPTSPLEDTPSSLPTESSS